MSTLKSELIEAINKAVEIVEMMADDSIEPAQITDDQESRMLSPLFQVSEIINKELFNL